MNKEMQSTDDIYQQLRTLIELSETVVKASKLIPEDQKRLYLGDYRTTADEAKTYADQKKNSFLKQLIEETLTPWNETYDEDSQRFWKLARQHKLPVEQKDYLADILKRGRIANFTEYNIVQDSIVIWQQDKRITKAQADQLDQMLGTYEQKKGTT